MNRLREARRFELDISVSREPMTCDCGNTIEPGDLYCTAVKEPEPGPGPIIVGYIYCLECGTHELERRAREWHAEQAKQAGLPIVEAS
jgi:hypothetical protein